MKAGELCTRDVAVAWRHESIVTAAQRMRNQHVGDLVVVDDVGARRVPVGIITDRDIVVLVVADGVDSVARGQVADAMSEVLVMAHLDDDVEDVLGRMTANGIRRIPLVDDEGGLAGLLAFDDVVAMLSEELVDLSHLIARQQRRERHVRV